MECKLRALLYLEAHTIYAPLTYPASINTFVFTTRLLKLLGNTTSGTISITVTLKRNSQNRNKTTMKFYKNCATVTPIWCVYISKHHEMLQQDPYPCTSEGKVWHREVKFYLHLYNVSPQQGQKPSKSTCESKYWRLPCWCHLIHHIMSSIVSAR